MLSSMGVEVDRRAPVRARASPDDRAWIYDFGLRRGASMPEGARKLFQDAFMAVWQGLAESDGFSALVLDGGLDWRKVSILRAYAKYFRQGGTPFSQEYIEASLLANVPIARLLVDLFEARFDPGDGHGPTAVDAEAHDRVAMATRLEQSDPARRSTPSRASTRTGSCAATCRPSRPRCARTSTSPTREAGPRPTCRSSSSRPRCPTCPSRDRRSRSSSTRRGSRACTCGSVRSRAVACAGPTGARTSAPRCSAWSRRRW